MRSTSCTLIFFLTFISTMEAQNFEIYTSPKLTKTHQSYLVNEKHTDGNETRSLKITRTDNRLTRSVLLKDEQTFLKMKEYQERIIALGYDLKSIATSSDKISILHHDYIESRYISSKS